MKMSNTEQQPPETARLISNIGFALDVHLMELAAKRLHDGTQETVLARIVMTSRYS